MGMPEVCPLARVENLPAYAWPDPDDPHLTGQIYDLAQAFPGGDLLLAASHRDTLWEKAYMLVGMENMMVYFLSESDFAREVLHRIMDFQLGIARHYLDLGVEMVFLGDDLGTQQGPLLGPRIVRAFLEPEYRRLFDLYRQHGVLIGFHSCGNIASVVEMLIDLGVNFSTRFRPAPTIWTACAASRTGAWRCAAGSTGDDDGRPEDRIIAEVRQRMRQLGEQGGYICYPDQSLPYPDAHLQAFHQAVESYGRYPMN